MKKLIWVLPVLALIIGCGGDEAENFFPLAVGNVWNYDLLYTEMNVDTTEYTGTSTTEITQETTLDNDVAVFEQVTTMVWDDTTMNTWVDTTYIRETEDYILIYYDLADTEPDTSLVLPVEEGNTWTVYADTTDTLTAEVVGQEDVTVPAGTYTDCWNVAYTSLGQAQDDWFAPEVGVVRQHMILGVAPFLNEFTRELTSSTIQ
ncbi:MAG: hypothetical protein JSW02_05295 [candidate division WOR-3 bacterium]|nr:MAG: hypothetical protein JSW02_05295 [candidate division WOR-3 bacterium]